MLICRCFIRLETSVCVAAKPSETKSEREEQEVKETEKKKHRKHRGRKRHSRRRCHRSALEISLIIMMFAYVHRQLEFILLLCFFLLDYFYIVFVWADAAANINVVF